MFSEQEKLGNIHISTANTITITIFILINSLIRGAFKNEVYL